MRRLPTLCGIPTAIDATSRSPCTFGKRNANKRGKFSTASKLSCVTAVPSLMRPSGAGDRSAKYDQVDWDYTLSTMQWTSWSFVVRAKSTDYDSSSIWGKRALPPEGEDTMQISTRRHDKVTIFDLSGDIDFANSPELRQSVLHEIQENRPLRVVINLSKVHYIDSSGVASLVEGLKASRDLGSHFILFGLSTSAREILQLSRLIKVFEIYENEEQALAV